MEKFSQPADENGHVLLPGGNLANYTFRRMSFHLEIGTTFLPYFELKFHLKPSLRVWVPKAPVSRAYRAAPDP